MSNEDATIMSTTLSKHKESWIDVMMSEELGLIAVDESPAKNAIVTFFSFILFGIIPLLPLIIAKIIDKNDYGYKK